MRENTAPTAESHGGDFGMWRILALDEEPCNEALHTVEFLFDTGSARVRNHHITALPNADALLRETTFCFA